MKFRRLAITAATLAMVFTGAIAVNAAETDTDADAFIGSRYARAEEALKAGNITQDEYDEMIAHIEEMVDEGLCEYGEGDGNGDGPALGLGHGAHDGEGEGRGMGYGNGAQDGEGEGRGLGNGAKDGEGEGRGMGLGNRDKSEDGERPLHDSEGRGMGYGAEEDAE